RRHRRNGLLVPVGDDVGESRWRRAQHGGGKQHRAKIGVHVALLCLGEPPLADRDDSLSGRRSAVNEPDGSPIAVGRQTIGNGNMFRLLEFLPFVRAARSDPLVLRLKCLHAANGMRNHLSATRGEYPDLSIATERSVQYRRTAANAAENFHLLAYPCN